MKNKYILIFGIAMVLLFLLIQVNIYPKKTSNLNITDPVKIPDEISFCNENAPLGKYYVKEKLDREIIKNMYWHSNTLLIIKKHKRYFDIIVPIIKSYNIPEDFKYLPIVESNLENVTSPKGAKGVWQIMKYSAKDYGMEVNRNVDERYDLEKSTHFACKYILKSKDKFNSWTLAAASYNIGVRALSREIKKQKINNYYELNLNIETSRYIYRILAMKEIVSKPHKYGFVIQPDMFYDIIPTKTIKVNYEIDDLVDWSEKNGITYKILKMNNPWLRQGFLRNKSKKLYKIKIPTKNI